MKKELQTSTVVKLSFTGLLCVNTVLIIMLVSQRAISGQQPITHQEGGIRGLGSVLETKLVDSTNATLSTDGVKNVTAVMISNGVKVSQPCVLCLIRLVR